VEEVVGAYCANSYVEGLGRSMESLSMDGRSPGRELNSVLRNESVTSIFGE
jgi:hypothetical protein